VPPLAHDFNLVAGMDGWVVGRENGFTQIHDNFTAIAENQFHLPLVGSFCEITCGLNGWLTVVLPK